MRWEVNGDVGGVFAENRSWSLPRTSELQLRTARFYTGTDMTQMKRKILPARRNHITQKVKIAGRRTLYLSVDDDEPPLEVFLRIRGDDVSAETTALFDVMARLISVCLQYGCPVETVGKLLQGVKVDPAGIVTGHDSIHFCSSLPDLIGQHLLSLSQPTPKE